MSELLGGLTDDEARIEVVNFFSSMYNLSHEVTYPNKRPPNLEAQEDPFIILDIRALKNELAYLGACFFSGTKILDISIWIREYTGIKEISRFTDFVNSLGVQTKNKVAYMQPIPAGKTKFKGWVVETVSIPFKY